MYFSKQVLVNVIGDHPTDLVTSHSTSGLIFKINIKEVVLGLACRFQGYEVLAEIM